MTMGKHLQNVAVLLVVLALGLYLSEWLLGFYLVKAVSRYPVAPFAVQRHVTVDYDVTYRYNNYGLRGPDFNPAIVYDVVLLGDSFFFGQGVGEGSTLADGLGRKGLKVFNISEIATNPIDYLHKLSVMQAQGLQGRTVVVGLYMGNDFQGIADKDIGPALAHPYRAPFLNYDARSFLTLERLRYQLTCKIQQIEDWFRRGLSGESTGETIVVHEFEHRRKFDSNWLRFFAGNRPEIIAAMARGGEPPAREELTEEAYLEKMQLTPQSFDKTVHILQAMPGRLPAARFCLVLIPDAHHVRGFRSKKYNSYVERLKTALSASYTIIDLHGRVTPAMQFLHDGHLNERGHRMVAEMIFPSLARVVPFAVSAPPIPISGPRR
jgi:hypothetical protein